MNRKYRIFAADLETTVFNGQTYTEAWASAFVELDTEDVFIFGSLSEAFEYLKSLNENILLYYHNLKFDGEFWLYFLLHDLKYEQALDEENNFLSDKDMPNKTFKYCISERGQWYNLKIKINNHYIELRDSLKLLPFSLEKIGLSFETKHKKLKMEYKGLRFENCYISESEKEYIKNDVLVLKEALEILFKEGYNKLTIGSCCLAEYKRIFGSREEWEECFPDVYNINLPPEYEYPTAGHYILKSYKGGWCYLVKGKENKIYNNGVTFDVNSLYPSVMHSDSGNRYPIGEPQFWSGNYIPQQALSNKKYFFIRIKTRFYLKSGFLPCIQIKQNFLYKSTEWLESSDIYNKKDGKYYNFYYENGIRKDTRVTLTLTQTDFKLILEHYELLDFEILDGCYFDSAIGLFDEYINKYKAMKQNNTGAKRQFAKLFLNNLYGKMATSINSSYKIGYLKESGEVGYNAVFAQNKKPVYIPVGSAITSYARDFTIRAAQKNYFGKDKNGFIYADTDSIHCDLPIENINGVKLHDKEFNCWKLETEWKEAIFLRQKTYIEIDKNTNEYIIKCAGMPEKSKQLLIDSFLGRKRNDIEYTEEFINFITTKRSIKDFKQGLKVPGKLVAKHIRGGIVLADTTFEIK